MEHLAAEGLVDKFEVMRRTQDRNFHPFEQYGIDLPEISESLEIPANQKPGIEYELKRLKLLEEKEIKKLRFAWPEVRFCYDLARCAGIGYYRGFCFKITAENRAGTIYPLADGGSCDWMEQLLCDKKERLLVSGFGTQLYASNF